MSAIEKEPYTAAPPPIDAVVIPMQVHIETVTAENTIARSMQYVKPQAHRVTHWMVWKLSRPEDEFAYWNIPFGD